MRVASTTFVVGTVVNAQALQNLSAVPDNVLPGAMSELALGFDMTSGDAWSAVRKQVFAWTWDFGNQLNWNGNVFSYPDQLSIAIRNECRTSEVVSSTAATTLTETMRNEAVSHGGGLDSGKIDVGFEAEGFKIGTSIQNSLMFSGSQTSLDYKSQFSESRSKSSLSHCRAWAYQSQLFENSLTDASFHPYFKDAVKSFAANPTRAKAHEFFDDFGTHLIQKAELGGEALRRMFFSDIIDTTAAEHFAEQQKTSGIDFFFIHSHKSSATTTDIKSTDQQEGSVYTTGTYVVGGNPAAGSEGEFCASLESLQTPRVMEFTKLLPLWDYFDKIDGVTAAAGAKLKAFVLEFWEAGERCATTTCGASASICAWHPASRSWAEPCSCLSQQALQTELASPDPLQSIQLSASSGHVARFPGWAVQKSSREWHLDLHSDCTIWDDGKLARDRAAEEYKMTFIIPPKTSMSVFINGQLVQQFSNGSDEEQQLTFSRVISGTAISVSVEVQTDVAMV